MQMACLLTEIMPSHKSLYGNSQEQSSQKMPHIMQEHSSKTFPQIDTHGPVLLNVRKVHHSGLEGKPPCAIGIIRHGDHRALSLLPPLHFLVI